MLNIEIFSIETTIKLTHLVTKEMTILLKSRAEYGLKYSLKIVITTQLTKV